MAVYSNTNENSPLRKAEFSPVSDGNFSFYYLDGPEKKQETVDWLTSKRVGQELVAETQVGGKPVLVMHGDKSKDQMLNVLAEHGEKLDLTLPDKPFNFWAWRGILSMTGHPMQLASSIMAKGGLDPATAVFAVSNLLANITNIMFGAQKSPDDNRLNYLKRLTNQQLGPEAPDGVDLPSLDEKCSDLRKEPRAPKTIGEKVHDFMERNSVIFGEIGLRYFGGVALVSPPTRWKGAFQELQKTGSLEKAFSYAKNPDKFTRIAGSFWLAGKTIGFFSKTPDPYDPKPKSWLDQFREDWVFKICTLTETMGAGTLAWDRLNNPKRKIKFRGKEYQDYLGGVGGLLFMAAFAMRLAAPFGVKKLNKEELYAHMSDSLAHMPPEKLPQLMSELAATVTDDLAKSKDKRQHITFGETFTQMMTDLYRYHHIALDNLGTEPEERKALLAKLEHNAPEEQQSASGTTPSTGVRVRRVLSGKPQSAVKGTHMASANHTDALAAQSPQQMGIS